jgi:hypothetical protein
MVSKCEIEFSKFCDLKQGTYLHVVLMTHESIRLRFIDGKLKEPTTGSSTEMLNRNNAMFTFLNLYLKVKQNTQEDY